MPFIHAVVWVDHHEAHVLHFNADAAENEHIRAHSKHGKLHTKSGIPGSGHAAEDQKYYHQVAQAVADVEEILIVGPSSGKLALLKHLQKHDPKVAEKVVGIESVDHPTDGQLLAYARHYFVKVDQMRGDRAIHKA